MWKDQGWNINVCIVKILKIWYDKASAIEKSMSQSTSISSELTLCGLIYIEEKLKCSDKLHFALILGVDDDSMILQTLKCSHICDTALSAHI